MPWIVRSPPFPANVPGRPIQRTRIGRALAVSLQAEQHHQVRPEIGFLIRALPFPED